MAEQLPLKQLVEGSNPPGVTKTRVQHPKMTIFWSGSWTLGVSAKTGNEFRIPMEFAWYTLSTPYRKRELENGE
jgi:hypothetical protein